MDLSRYEKPEYYVNRELSWLKFDERVLSEARDKSLPLFERLKFLSITSSNLDEFFMVRVASLKDQVHAGYEKTDIAGMGPKAQLKEISAQTHELVRQLHSLSLGVLVGDAQEDQEALSDLSDHRTVYGDGGTFYAGQYSTHGEFLLFYRN